MAGTGRRRILIAGGMLVQALRQARARLALGFASLAGAAGLAVHAR